MLTSSDQWSHPAFSAYCDEINNHAWEREKEADISISPYSHSYKKEYKFEICYFSIEE